MLKLIRVFYVWMPSTLFDRLILMKKNCLYTETGTRPEPWFNIKMPSHQYRKSHCGDKTVARQSYLHNRISYTGKTTSLYWIRPLISYVAWAVVWSKHCIIMWYEWYSICRTPWGSFLSKIKEYVANEWACFSHEYESTIKLYISLKPISQIIYVVLIKILQTQSLQYDKYAFSHITRLTSLTKKMRYI